MTPVTLPLPVPATRAAGETLLLPGQWLTAEERGHACAVVSSGVVVLLWDGRVGGAGHFSLSQVRGSSAQSSPRYGEVLLPRLLDDLVRHHAVSTALHAVVFGGACTIPAFSAAGGNLGQHNVDFALSWLATHGIQVTEQVTGGRDARRISMEVVRGQFGHESVTGRASGAAEFSTAVAGTTP